MKERASFQYQVRFNKTGSTLQITLPDICVLAGNQITIDSRSYSLNDR